MAESRESETRDGGQEPLDATAGSRISSGFSDDREFWANRLLQSEAEIRRRISGKLSPGVRSVFDSQEIMSTVLRRVDRYVLGGGMAVETEGQFWSLIQRVIRNAIIDKVRIVERLRAAERDDAVLARLLLSRVDESTTDDQDVGIVLQRAMRALPDPEDRDALWLWLKGTALNTIAEHLDLTPEAMRKRWQRSRERLAEALAEDPAR